MPTSAFWDPLSTEQMEGLLRELGATEDTVRRDVTSIREWMGLQPHLPHLDGTGTDVDHLLRMYLLRCKNSVERAKEALDTFLSGRTSIPEFFAQRDPTAPDVQGSFDHLLMATMPRLTAEGYRVHYYAYPSSDGKGFSAEAMFRRALMMAELMLRDDMATGEVIVLDLANGSAARLREFTIAMSLFSKFVRGGLKMYPLRMHRFHIINQPPFMSAALSLLGHVMKEKLYSRVIVEPAGASSLLKKLPLECIPQDYGGQGPSMREGNGLWRRYLGENRDWFLTHEAVKSDESKRVGTANFSFLDDMQFGCPGSFRTLAVD